MNEGNPFPEHAPEKPPTIERLAHNNTETSRAAAESMRQHSPEQREMVRQFFVDHGEHGASQEEAEQAPGLSGNSLRPRSKELEKAGEIAKSTEKRKTTARREAIVWKACSPLKETRTNSDARWPLDTNPQSSSGSSPISAADGLSTRARGRSIVPIQSPSELPKDGQGGFRNDGNDIPTTRTKRPNKTLAHTARSGRDVERLREITLEPHCSSWANQVHQAWPIREVLARFTQTVHRSAVGEMLTQKHSQRN